MEYIKRGFYWKFKIYLNCLFLTFRRNSKRWLCYEIKGPYFYNVTLVAVEEQYSRIIYVMIKYVRDKERPREVFHQEKMFLEISKFTGKHLCQSLFFNKVAGLSSFIRKRLWHRRFYVNFPKFLKTSFFTEHLRETASGDTDVKKRIILTHFSPKLRSFQRV